MTTVDISLWLFFKVPNSKNKTKKNCFSFRLTECTVRIYEKKNTFHTSDMLEELICFLQKK